MLYGILLILLSLLAVPSILVAVTPQKPEVQKVLNAIEPFQSWIGLLFILIGSIELIDSILRIPVLFIRPVWWLSFLAVGILTTLLAGLLGYPLIRQYFLKGSNAEERAQEVHNKIRKYQGMLGVIGVVLGIWMIIINTIGVVL